MSYKIRAAITSDKLKFLSQALSDRERAFIKNTFKASDKKDTVAYVLVNNDIPLGFIALSASRVDAIPVVLIDYIFVACELRKQTIAELSNVKISEFLLSVAMRKVHELQKSIGIRWLALLPDNEQLETFYISHFGFSSYREKTRQTYLFYKI
jgi:hypothetical protein